MTKTEKLNIMKDRLVKLSNNPKNIKCPGVMHKLRRKIDKLEAELSE